MKENDKKEITFEEFLQTVDQYDDWVYKATRKNKELKIVFKRKTSEQNKSEDGKEIIEETEAVDLKEVEDNITGFALDLTDLEIEVNGLKKNLVELVSVVKIITKEIKKMRKPNLLS